MKWEDIVEGLLMAWLALAVLIILGLALFVLAGKSLSTMD